MDYLTPVPVVQFFYHALLFYVHRRAEDLTRELETLRDDLQVSDNIFLHCTENPISVFQKMKLRGLVTNPIPTHVSVGDCLFGYSKISRLMLGIYK